MSSIDGATQPLSITDQLIKLKEAQTNATFGSALVALAKDSASLDADSILSSTY
ncbi:hypothetical protein [Bacillus sp. FJAT-45037]|uniref:hypothetical protein n=1 Tax=Bacillus sp. FJAT-45037 TaxID=2011007 RepID=UPI0012FD3597|nr:hypothetical protein [Bacillus sp. FJAT-45037]